MAVMVTEGKEEQERNVSQHAGFSSDSILSIYCRALMGGTSHPTRRTSSRVVFRSDKQHVKQDNTL